MGGLLDKHRQSRQLTTFVENRTIYYSDYSELNIYETHQVAEKVSLSFDYPIIASMLTGRKVMHLKDLTAFDFLPGESIVAAANEELVIDFPDATEQNPTQCLALAIDNKKIEEVIFKFNEKVSIEKENNNWDLSKTSSPLVHDAEINYLIERLLSTFVDKHATKDVLLDLMIQELIVRLLQTKARYCFFNGLDGVMSDTRIGMVIKYIKEHLTEHNMNIDLLANKAQMSSSHFFKKFKNTLGVSPIEYINAEKIKFAKKLIKENKKMYISEVAYKSGFNSVSYFNRQFKKLEMITPQQFKKSIA